jgi:excisionase family DNA binding protein
MSHARRRLTVAQAADQLGVTVDAIRSRVKRGTIDHVREGGRVYIMLGGAQHATRRVQGTDQDTAQATDAGPGHRDALVEELRDRVRYLERQVEEERDARRRADTLLARLMDRVPELEAPSEPQESPESSSEASDTAAEPRSAPEGQ